MKILPFYRYDSNFTAKQKTVKKLLIIEIEGRKLLCSSFVEIWKYCIILAQNSSEWNKLEDLWSHDKQPGLEGILTKMEAMEENMMTGLWKGLSSRHQLWFWSNSKVFRFSSPLVEFPCYALKVILLFKCIFAWITAIHFPDKGI